jgi:hypothetical protein
MCVDSSGKRVVLHSIMEQYMANIGHGTLPDLKWHAIDGMSTFFRTPCQVMESLTADHKPTLDLVPMSVSLLLKHCDDSKQQLQEINDKLMAVGMKAKLEKYRNKLVQEPVIIVAYINPKIPKSTDLAELKLVVDLVRNSLQCRYSAKVSSC